MNKRCVWAATVSKRQNEVVITFIVGKYKAGQAKALNSYLGAISKLKIRKNKSL